MLIGLTEIPKKIKFTFSFVFKLGSVHTHIYFPLFLDFYFFVTQLSVLCSSAIRIT